MVVVVDNPDLAAVVSGIKSANDTSKLALGGLGPSAGSPRGGPPPADPLLPQFRACISALNGLGQALDRQGDNPRSIDVSEFALKLSRMSNDRATDIAKAGMPQQQSNSGNALNAIFPNINGGGNV